jgi:hypothetical protein
VIVKVHSVHVLLFYNPTVLGQKFFCCLDFVFRGLYGRPLLERVLYAGEKGGGSLPDGAHYLSNKPEWSVSVSLHSFVY